MTLGYIVLQQIYIEISKTPPKHKMFRVCPVYLQHVYVQCI